MNTETIEQSTGEIVVQQQAPALPILANSGTWELAQRAAKAFAASSLVPAAYQSNVANCLVAMEMANRMGASPLLVMQNLHVIHGNPGWSAKFLIACFNQGGKFTSIRYEWNSDRTSCRAWATEKSTGDRIDGPTVSMQMAKDEGWSTKTGSKWKTMPELMLMYRAAAFLVRTYAPEISMGLQTDDEIIDITPEPARKGTGLEAVRAAISAPAKAVESPDQSDAFADFCRRIGVCDGPGDAKVVVDEAHRVLNDDYFSKVVEHYDFCWPDAG